MDSLTATITSLTERVEALEKQNGIESQLDRILDKQKQLILQADDNGNINVLGTELHFNSGIDVRKVVEELETYRKKREKVIGL